MRRCRELIRLMVALGIVALIGPSLVTSPLADEQGRRSDRANADERAHWPRFRGPDSNPVSDNPNLPIK